MLLSRGKIEAIFRMGAISGSQTDICLSQLIFGLIWFLDFSKYNDAFHLVIKNKSVYERMFKNV